MILRLSSSFPGPAVEAALADVRRDLARVLARASGADGWELAVNRSSALAPETFVIKVSSDRSIAIDGSDELGAIYGLYEFSHRFLGVDPLWFWKDLPPAPLAAFDPAPQRVESGSPAFRYRGWFINDEDLLGRWREPAGRRFADWPGRERTLRRPPTDREDNYEYRLLEYYAPVVSAEAMEMFFEAALRLRVNLVIPASFVDVMNEAEAALLRAAVRRGLQVTQHHVEPLGVSHFAFESWWTRTRPGAPLPSFSYRESPAALRACWEAYARRWHEIAGQRVVWQVGLRGRGDRPLWTHDPEAAARAGDFISAALEEQMAIVRAVDPRPAPPATLTLWLEGAELVATGRLRAPHGVTYVFADHHLTQEMQEDFHTLPREPGRDHGFYYHVAVWSMGPHLVQGPTPEKVARAVGEVFARGDTGYAILNVANLREHVLGAFVWSRQVWRPTPVDTQAFLREWSPPGLAAAHAEFLSSIPELAPGWRLYDGSARTLIDRLLALHACGKPLEGLFLEHASVRRETTLARLEESSARLARVLEQLHARARTVDARHRAFLEAHLLVQTGILLGLYRALVALLRPPPDFAAARDALGSAVDILPLGEAAPWTDWYRGDTKVGLKRLQDRAARLASPVVA